MSKSDQPLNILTEKHEVTHHNEGPENTENLDAVLPPSLSAEKSKDNEDSQHVEEPKMKPRLKTKKKSENKNK